MYIQAGQALLVNTLLLIVFMGEFNWCEFNQHRQ